jgi:hypothetical protein
MTILKGNIFFVFKRFLMRLMLFKRRVNELKCELESQHLKDIDKVQVEKQLRKQLCNLERFINISFLKMFLF